MTKKNSFYGFVVVLAVVSIILSVIGITPDFGGDDSEDYIAVEKPYTESFAPFLRTGNRGRKVKDAQWLLSGKNKFRIKTYSGRLDGVYGIKTRNAVARMKYRLGFPGKALKAPEKYRFGRDLYLFLRGKRALPPLYRERMKRRWTHLRYGYTGYGVVTKVGNCRSYPPRAHVIQFWRRVAAIYGRPLVCYSGARPWRRYVSGGGVSDHYLGNAADISTTSPAMNYAVGRAALVAAGMPRDRARRMTHPAQYGWRYNGVNIVFGCYCFGNHWNHVHGGLRALPAHIARMR